MDLKLNDVNNVQNNTIFWRTDTKALIGGVVLGIAFMVVQQVTGRIDGVLWPSLHLLNGISWAVFTGLICLTMRQPAGMIMGLTQGLIAVASGLSPVALFFIPANVLGALTYSIVIQRLSMDKMFNHFLAQLATNIVGNICVGAGLYLILKLPLSVVLIASAITAGAGIIGSTILTKLLADMLKRAGLAKF